MLLPRYEEHEKDFLEVMATKFCFTGKTRIVFLQRFCEKNAELNDTILADEWQGELLEGKNAKNPATILRDRLNAICNKLEDEGCDFGDTERGRWKIGKAWLQKVKFAKWAKEQGLVVDTPLNLAQLWNQLKTKARHTNKMGPVLVPAIGTLEMWEQPSQYLKTVPQEKHIQFHIELEESGYLILLEKGSSGKLWCLCPSFLAPQSYVNPGKVILPQENPRQKTFKTSRPGSEELVAIIAATFPPFPWLPKSDQNPSQLQESHLSELLEYLEGGIKSSILYMDYAITAS